MNNWRAWWKTMLGEKFAWNFFSSKVPEFSCVAFKLMEKHLSVFFFIGFCFIFEKKCMQKTKFFLAACLWDLLFEWETKETFCFKATKHGFLPLVSRSNVTMRLLKFTSIREVSSKWWPKLIFLSSCPYSIRYSSHSENKTPFAPLFNINYTKIIITNIKFIIDI